MFFFPLLNKAQVDVSTVRASNLIRSRKYPPFTVCNYETNIFVYLCIKAICITPVIALKFWPESHLKPNSSQSALCLNLVGASKELQREPLLKLRCQFYYRKEVIIPVCGCCVGEKLLGGTDPLGFHAAPLHKAISSVYRVRPDSLALSLWTISKDLENYCMYCICVT